MEITIGKTGEGTSFATMTTRKNFQQKGGICYINNQGGVPGIKKINLQPKNIEKLLTVKRGIINQPLFGGSDSTQEQFLVAILNILKNRDNCKTIFNGQKPQLAGIIGKTKIINVNGPTTISGIEINGRTFCLQETNPGELSLDEEKKLGPPPKLTIATYPIR